MFSGKNEKISVNPSAKFSSKALKIAAFTRKHGKIREREIERERLKGTYRIPGEQIQTSTAIFSSNVRLTRSTADGVVPYTLLAYPCLHVRMQQTYACSRVATKPTKSEDFKDSLCI